MPVPFFDPHFHIWDVTGAAPFTDASQLFAPAGTDGLYDTAAYEASVAGCADAGLAHCGGVFVEAMSVQHPDTPAAELNRLCLAECAWAVAQLSAHAAAGAAGKTYAVVASVALEAPDVEATLAALVQLGTAAVRVVGVRQIVNHAPSWPRNDATGDLLSSEAWQAGYARLARHGLTFDLQLNPHQMDAACALVAAHPDVRVVIDHLGTPLPADLASSDFLAKMTRFSKLPHCCVKLSMLWYADATVASATLAEAAKAVLAAFTPARVMAASNFPVDPLKGWPAVPLFKALRKLTAHLTPAEEEEVYCKAAKRFYGL
eukprot:Rhum_TRINITY_DN13174_c0_g2::Rhum_TRINITY_DN13174_c0_g2_i1::g.57593::m.57593